MIKKYRNIILTNASIIGFSLNNVKAAKTGELTIKIDNIEYKFSTGIEDNITDVDKLLDALNSQTLTGPGSKNLTLGNNVKEKYFLKSLVNVNSEDAAAVKIDDNLIIKLTKGKKVKIELVSKRNCIKFNYTGAKQLTKAAEDVLLKTVIQGKKLNNIAIDGVIDTDFGNSTLNNVVVKNGTNTIGKEVKVLDENNKIEFKIDSSKIANNHFKTVVCKFAERVEEKLVAGVDLEKLCDEFKAEGIKKDNLKLTDVLTSLNKCNVKDANSEFFKNLDGASIIKNGDSSSDANVITGETPKSFSAANFVVIDGIKEENINPIFLKKTFKVEFDNTDNGDKKVAEGILETIENNLKANFGDKVVFSVQDIITKIKDVTTSGGSPSAIFKKDAFNTLGNVTISGVSTTPGANLAGGDNVNSSVITIKIKEAAFAEGVVKTEIKITCNLDNVKKGDNKLKGDVKDIIFPILNGTLTEATTIDAIITELNTKLDGKFADSSKKIADTDIVFSNVSTNGNITKSGTITIKNDFVNKLKDDCFETPAKPKGGNGSGSSNGDEQKGDDKKEGKGCSGSGKKNK